MRNLSFWWFLLITAVTVLVYWIFRTPLKGTRQRLPLLALLGTTYVYSGVGIAYDVVAKTNFFYYLIFISVLALAYCFFILVRFKSLDGGDVPRLIDDTRLWESSTARKIYIGIMVLYLALRCVSLVYPVNHLVNFRIVYDSRNNINNITAQSASAISTLAKILSPLFYVGIYYAVKKVRHVAILMGLDAFISLIISQYLSRHVIVSIVAICVMLYINNSIGRRPVTLSKKRTRTILILAIVVPLVINMMLELMSARLSSGQTFTLWEMIESEICYPLHYSLIHKVSPVVDVKDFFLQMLDSFVPILPTPSYHMDLNVDFSSLVLGLSVREQGFYIKLPGLLGESILLFGEHFFWVHAIIIAFLTALIYKVVGENKHLVILWYHYVISVLKTGRAGYAELSQSVWLNYVVFFVVILTVRLINGAGGTQNVRQNR